VRLKKQKSPRAKPKKLDYIKDLRRCGAAGSTEVLSFEAASGSWVLRKEYFLVRLIYQPGVGLIYSNARSVLARGEQNKFEFTVHGKFKVLDVEPSPGNPGVAVNEHDALSFDMRGYLNPVVAQLGCFGAFF
jgi:hypothetical protein